MEECTHSTRHASLKADAKHAGSTPPLIQEPNLSSGNRFSSSSGIRLEAFAKTVSVTVGRHRTRAISPRPLYCVTGSRRDVVLADRKQLPSHQPVHCNLRRALRHANRFRHFHIAHLHRPISSSLFGIEPEIQEKAGRFPVMANEVAHEHVDHVIVKRKHRYTDHQYSIGYHIAVRYS
jgi:hypothetical protein